MPWGQRTAFFEDPEGYIHEIFSELPTLAEEWITHGSAYIVIDDDHNIVEIMQLALKSGGYDSDSAYDAREGMAKACRTLPTYSAWLQYASKGWLTWYKISLHPRSGTSTCDHGTALSIPDVVAQALTIGIAGFWLSHLISPLY